LVEPGPSSPEQAQAPAPAQAPAAPPKQAPAQAAAPAAQIELAHAQDRLNPNQHKEQQQQDSQMLQQNRDLLSEPDPSSSPVIFSQEEKESLASLQEFFQKFYNKEHPDLRSRNTLNKDQYNVIQGVVSSVCQEVHKKHEDNFLAALNYVGLPEALSREMILAICQIDSSDSDD
tara:strand:- start:214 stop:735 length:522 start_codon:yes stop_codon:yes gene_type:complete